MRPDAVKIAMGQIAALPTLEENLELAGNMIDEAAEKGAKLICFPEVGFEKFFPRTYHDVTKFESAQPIPGPITDFLCKKAKEKEIVVVASLLEEGYVAEYYDSAVVIDADGSLLGTSRMMHIAENGEDFDEKFYYCPGNTGWPVYDTAAGKIGIAICYDSYFPEAIRCLTMNGAEIVLVPTCTAESTGAGFPPTDFPEGPTMELIDFVQKANAFCNSIFIGWCNRAGQEDDMELCGRSRVFDPFGRMIATGGKEESEVVIADIDFAKIRGIRSGIKFLSDRRPESYTALARIYGSKPVYDKDKVSGIEPDENFSGKL